MPHATARFAAHRSSQPAHRSSQAPHRSSQAPHRSSQPSGLSRLSARFPPTGCHVKGKTKASSRRLDHDWLRIAAFGLLILYHSGMFYVSWDWHVKSPHARPLPLEATLLIAVTATSCMIAALAAMRWRPLGIVLGATPETPLRPAPA
ncbi:hypothetical protein [Sandaracinobacteroides hominis]|uniref:hypothetical protein n=1 Tax=Sandaracinobacteroides hominis TaxID=2780086 RepID=UPI0018F6B90C|nr:hypothetical protein [Sandaracinobacteroides hominis]